MCGHDVGDTEELNVTAMDVHWSRRNAVESRVARSEHGWGEMAAICFRLMLDTYIP